MSDQDSPKDPKTNRGPLTTLVDGRTVDTESLFEVLYEDLRRVANAVFASEHPGQTLQPTALVGEAYLRLVNQKSEWKNREHFVAIAARSMRRALLDQARARGARKRGGDRQRVTFFEEGSSDAPLELDVVELDEALTQLAQVSERLVRVTELRIFAGLGPDETAKVLGVSRATAARDWSKASTLLRAYVEDA